MSRQIKMRYLWEGKWYFIDFRKDNPHLKFKEFEERPKTTRLYLWTGLLDKNKKEIYAGDVLRDKLGSVAFVSFSNGGFTLLMSTKELTRQINTRLKEKKFERDSCFRDYEEYNKWYDCEVIGNIYENPELLKKKIKCNCCLKDKEEYVSRLCKECADKMDKHILMRKNETI